MIFQVIWSNDDEYGMLEWIMAIVQADSQNKAKEFAKEQILNLYPTVDFNKYEKFTCKNITKEKMLILDVHP